MEIKGDCGNVRIGETVLQCSVHKYFLLFLAAYFLCFQVDSWRWTLLLAYQVVVFFLFLINRTLPWFWSSLEYS